jgi:hypothetical protein
VCFLGFVGAAEATDNAGDGVGDVLAVGPVGSSATLGVAAVPPAEADATAVPGEAGVVVPPGALVGLAGIAVAGDRAAADVVADGVGGPGRFRVGGEAARETGALHCVRDEARGAGIGRAFHVRVGDVPVAGEDGARDQAEEDK